MELQVPEAHSGTSMSCGPKTTGYRSPAGRSATSRDALPDLNRELHLSRSRARFALTNLGSWSSGTYLPMGAVCNRRTGHTMLWQVEHNGAWHWELGEFAGAAENASYVALLGPTDSEHHWRVTLNPGESFETVPVAVAVSPRRPGRGGRPTHAVSKGAASAPRGSSQAPGCIQ